MPRKTSATGHGLRRFTLGSGPLKRTSDRLEYLARILLALVLLLAIAVALAVATATYTGLRSEATAQAADRRQVSAELLESPSSEMAVSEGIAEVGQATAVWTAPTGVERQGVITAPIQARAGSSIHIWVDRDGDQTSPPLSDGDVAALTAGHALLTYIGITLVALLAYRLVRRLLDRSRARRWAAEWAAIEPVWTGKVP